MEHKTRLAYVVSHPIQYQAPLLRLLAQENSLAFRALFMSDFSTKGYKDAGFGGELKWDVPLLGGYEHTFLPKKLEGPITGFWWPKNFGISKYVNPSVCDVAWTHGFHNWTLLRVILNCRRFRIPYMVRAESQWQCVIRGRGMAKAGKDAMVRWIVRNAGACLTVGTLNAQYYRSFGVPEERLFSVPYAVDNASFEEKAHQTPEEKSALRRSLGLPSEAKIVLFASKLQTRKRVEDLCGSMQLVWERCDLPIVLVVVGSGEREEALRAKVEEDGNGHRAILLGFQNQAILPKIMGLADLFVLPSDTEPWGLVVNEAMAVGLPVVVTDEVGCGPDLVQNGRNGHIVKVGDKPALADAILDVVRDDTRNREMGRASQRIISTWSYKEDVAGIKAAVEYVTRARRRP